MTEQEPDERHGVDDIEMAGRQIDDQVRSIDYETRDWTVEFLVQLKQRGDLFIPSYQRAHVWDHGRKCRFIESLLIGLPVTFLFLAERQEDGKLEVVDGMQRTATCEEFVASNGFELTELERLPLLDGFRYRDLPDRHKRRLLNRPLRCVVLGPSCTAADRADLFDRINTGQMAALDAEVRRGAQPGPVTRLLDELAEDPLFNRLAPFSKAAQRRRAREDVVLRFFAYGDGLDGYRDRVGEFLTQWLESANTRAVGDPSFLDGLRDRFRAVMGFAERHFPEAGFAKKAGATQTPRVRFDALAVGVWRALRDQPDLQPSPISAWIDSDGFKEVTKSGSQNVRSQIEARIDFVYQALKGRPNA